MKRLSISVIAGALIPVAGFAHEGHGSSNGQSIIHYFLEPEHGIYSWSFLMASFILIAFYIRRKKRSSN